MAKDKNTVVVYKDWIGKFEALNDDEAGRLIKHFFRYVNDLNPDLPDRITEISFLDIENTLKRDLKKWGKTLEGRSKAGKASAEKRKLKKISQQSSTNSTSVELLQQSSTLSTVSVSVSVNDSDIKKERFLKFWKLYPKKVAKSDCLKKWMKLSDSDIDKISLSIKKFISYKPFDDYIHPNPKTYLNQKRWEDEMPTGNDLSTETMDERILRLTEEAKQQ